jgi:hypothetical protein
MDSTETKYVFYKRAFKGGAQTKQKASQPQSETINIQPQPQQQVEQTNDVQENKTENQTQEQDQTQNEGQNQEQNIAPDGASLDELNQEIPKNKINFKVSTIVGNLDQTLSSKQKINFDQLLMKQLFGSD